MTAIVKQIISVEPFGDNLSIVKTNDDDIVIANRKEDGSFRWSLNEYCVYVSENSVIPEDILKDRGYWDFEKNRGLLGGGKYNKVKGRNFGPDDNRVRSIGLLFKVHELTAPILFGGKMTSVVVSKPEIFPENPDGGSQTSIYVNLGDDVSKFFGIE